MNVQSISKIYIFPYVVSVFIIIFITYGSKSLLSLHMSNKIMFVLRNDIWILISFIFPLYPDTSLCIFYYVLSTYVSSTSLYLCSNYKAIAHYWQQNWYTNIVYFWVKMGESLLLYPSIHCSIWLDRNNFSWLIQQLFWILFEYEPMRVGSWVCLLWKIVYLLN